MPRRTVGWWTAAALIATAGALAAAAGPGAIDALIAAERAFAKSSIDSGTRHAFISNLSPGAIVFQPGPVNGLRAWQARPERPARLAWTPSFVELSGSENFGFSSGPWEWSPTADAAPAAFGHFFTVWRRTTEAGWKVELDVGISHDKTGPPLDQVEVTRGPAHAKPDSTQWRKWGVGVGVRGDHAGASVGTAGVGVGVFSGGLGFGFGSGGVRSRHDYEWRRTAHEKNELMSVERRLPFEARKAGWDPAYRAVAATDLRIYREGTAPQLGVDAAIEASAKLPRTREYLPRGNGVAPSWDLGYAYGLAVSPATTRGAKPDTAAYVHCYRKDDAGAWRMMADIENPFPRR